MDNLALELIDEVTEKETFVVNNDQSAEWALNKILEEKKELQRTELVIDSIIAEYQFKKQQAQEQFEKKTQYFKILLMNYFETVDKKKTKTQETYKLPSGTLVKKYGGQEFKRDEEALLNWIKSVNRNDLVKVKESPDWSTLKGEVTVNNGKVITGDGEIVEGVDVINKPDTFDIKF